MRARAGLLALATALVAAAAAAASFRQKINFFFMKFARDVGRIKARRRRFNQKHAIIPVLLLNRDLPPLPLGAADAGIAITLEELQHFDGRYLNQQHRPAQTAMLDGPMAVDAGLRTPLYVALGGRIYDVSPGWSFYGPGKSYHPLVGRDASRAFCTGCLEPECLIGSLEGLGDAQRKELLKWIEFYEHHDKYRLVGKLRTVAPEQAGVDEDGEVAHALSFS